MKRKILRILKNSPDFVSGEKLSEVFHMTRSGIWKYINMLKEDGYDIESIPRKGYRILSSPDILTLEEIEGDLDTDFIGRNIYYYNTIDSTNNKAKEIAREEIEGSLVVAEEQTGGKGRLGRSWVSPKGKGIWMSLILKPNVEPFKLGPITLLGAASVYKALEKNNVKSQIKWPNDILIEDKKIAGILTEMSAELNIINYLVMGIGINVNLEDEDLPSDLKNKATSIRIKENRVIDRKKLLADILNEFEDLYISFLKTGSSLKAIDICRENSATIGRNIKLVRDKEEKNAKALDINTKGELIVEFENGQVENIFAGEVSIRVGNGYI